MKKLVALVLAAVMLLGITSAFAEGEKITLTLSSVDGISAPFAVAGHSDLAACSITATSGTLTFNLLSVGN